MKLATVEKIHSICAHPNADNLCTAKIKGWPVVVKKNQFSEGELVIFIQIDSIVPSSNQYFDFMAKQRYRVWNARFRGAPSQGLVCPLSAFGLSTWGNPHQQVNEGDDVTAIIGVTKYEKPIDFSIMGDAKGRFPLDLVTITDEDNLLSYPEVLDELKGETVYITQKMDGSSMTVIWKDGELRVCSRRLELKESDRSAFWKVVYDYKLKEKFQYTKEQFAFQAEVVGPKMNGNRLGLTELDMYVFNLRNLETMQYYGLGGIHYFCQTFDLKPAPLVKYVKNFAMTVDDLQQLANEQVYPNGEKGEGIVVRPTQIKHSYVLNKNLSVKLINQEYKQ